MSLTTNPPASSKVIEAFLSRVGFALPAGYEKFIRRSNGAEGFLQESYLILWPVEDLFTHNEAYRVKEYAPEFFIVGSDGGDISYAADKQTGALYAMPFIGMSPEQATWLAKDFDDFLNMNLTTFRAS